MASENDLAVRPRLEFGYWTTNARMIHMYDEKDCEKKKRERSGHTASALIKVENVSDGD